MLPPPNLFCYLLFSALLFLASLNVHAVELQGSVDVEARYFTEANEGQYSAAIEPEWYWQNNDASHAIIVKPFARIDSLDDERSHTDLREFYWQHATDTWELRAGINKIFWGVTESQHLVDIINQTDNLEGIDGEDKLGQPMIQFTHIQEWGVVDVFILPYFRARKFTGEDGHFRLPLTLADEAVYQSSDEEQHTDFAMRYSHTLGDIDLGISYFNGTNRTPTLIAITPNNAAPYLVAYYDQLQQAGLDAQATLGSWLWKLETVYREDSQQDYSASTAGVEYTFFGIAESATDLGLLVEISRDSRGELANSVAQKDVFIGGRLTPNDEQSSELLFGISQDLDNSHSYSGKLEAARRMNDNMKLSVEAWFFNSKIPSDPLYLFRNEDFMQISLGYYF